jgi:hypothetical protein
MPGNSKTKGKSVGRIGGKEREQLYDETMRIKMQNNQFREDNVKLKTRVKIMENELSRKEKALEDLFN